MDTKAKHTPDYERRKSAGSSFPELTRRQVEQLAMRHAERIADLLAAAEAACHLKGHLTSCDFHVWGECSPPCTELRAAIASAKGGAA